MTATFKDMNDWSEVPDSTEDEFAVVVLAKDIMFTNGMRDFPEYRGCRAMTALPAVDWTEAHRIEAHIAQRCPELSRVQLMHLSQFKQRYFRKDGSRKRSTRRDVVRWFEDPLETIYHPDHRRL